MLIGFGYFSGYLRPGLLAAEVIDIETTCTGGICAKTTYTEGIDAVKHLGIHLQSF